MQILLIGCGKMGSAMLSAWLDSNIVTRAIVVDRHPNDITRQFSQHQNVIQVFADVTALPADITPDLTVLAVKPQQMGTMLASLAPRLLPAWPVMTIAAGLRSEFYNNYLLENPIIRAMPNTPALLGKGMTVAATAHYMPTALRELIEDLMRATGDFFWLKNEDELDAAAAVSGSGVAYFIYLAEQMAKAGETNGLTPEQAARLARQTLVGAGAIVEARLDAQLMQLRQDVTSPGGVTAAAIAAWDQDNAFQKLVAAGVDANIRRSQELAKN